MQNFKTGFILLATVVLGCGSTPEEKEPQPTFVDATITVSPQVNPDLNQRPSPIVIRVYELKNLGKYTESDFDSLFENYESALSSDLLGSDKFHLNPGENHKFKKSVSHDTRYIAVSAAYREINRAVWRDSIVIPAEKATQLLIFVDKLNISIWKK